MRWVHVPNIGTYQRTERTTPDGEHSSRQEMADASGGRRSGGAGRRRWQAATPAAAPRRPTPAAGNAVAAEVKDNVEKYKGAADLHRARRRHRPVDVARQEHVPHPARPEPVQPEHPGDDEGHRQEGRDELHHLPQPGQALRVGAGHERRHHREARHHRAQHGPGPAHSAAPAGAGQEGRDPRAGHALLRRLVARPTRLRRVRCRRDRARHGAVQRRGQGSRRLDHRRTRAARRTCW